MSSVDLLELCELPVSGLGESPGQGGGAGVSDTTPGPFDESAGYEFAPTFRR